MKIAVIGAGISGLTAAHVLQREHDVTVFERGGAAGGHASTVDVELRGRRYAVDTGFVVYNETTYPGFVKLIGRLGVETQPTDMSFSVSCEATGLEYSGASLNALFAQRRNLLSLSFLAMLLDIVRFNRAAGRAARNPEATGRLGELVARTTGTDSFRRHYLVPLVAAIWSLDPSKVDDFPAPLFLRFTTRHRLLQVSDQLRWRVIRGGSRTYVERLLATLRNGVHTRARVRGIRRNRQGVEIRLDDGPARQFDRVVIAVHSDQALRLLEDPSDDERELLGAIAYQENDVTLHTDSSLLPANRRAWASWNYRVKREGGDARPVTTYDMSALQGLDSPVPLCVTLNDDAAIDPAKVIRSRRFSHPVYDAAAVAAQQQKARISGVRHTHYCGAYWGYGFHEDGVASALDVCRAFGLEL